MPNGRVALVLEKVMSPRDVLRIRNAWYCFRESQCIFLTTSALLHKVNIQQCSCRKMIQKQWGFKVYLVQFSSQTASQEESIKNQSQQTEEQFHSQNTRLIQEKPLHNVLLQDRSHFLTKLPFSISHSSLMCQKNNHYEDSHWLSAVSSSETC